MIPVLTPDQMRAADSAALASVVDDGVFIARAGRAVAQVARTMMGGTYGRRVVVVAGKGHNGDDGRVAGQWLAQWGARVRVLDASVAGGEFLEPGDVDLVVDAAYGIGFRGEWSPPIVWGVPVLAVDIPSGLDAGTGTVSGGVLVADRTVTFAAPKTGLFFGEGPAACGEIDLVDVGIDTAGCADVFVVETADVAAWLEPRARDAHKWNHALRVVAGSPGMGGAAALVSASAMRAGAGIVHLSWRGTESTVQPPTEVVGRHLPPVGWDRFVAADVSRFGAMVVGPGLGRGDDVGAEVRSMLMACTIPTVIDGDGIAAAIDPAGTHETLRARAADTLLTPHDGEFAMLGGDADDPDRIAATRRLAATAGCTVMRKGPPTFVADPEGAVLLVVSGDQRLATAGSGDVLAGIAGAFMARGLAAPIAAAAAAHVHGLAAAECAVEGTIARDLVAAIADVLSAVARTAVGGADVG
ncbi:MAG: NAD(P)H-hydrate dehydratase [Actinomycetota bacterium]